ncbi:MAG: YceI family protein [Vicingus serpentipes]|nr:YceI family protein [Vicingus serpentipes]
MKKIILGLSLSVLSVLSITAEKNVKHNHDELNINTEKSSVEWIGKKVAGAHNGTIKIKEGKLHLHDGNLERGTVVMDMTSIVCLDLEGEWKGKLEKHLKNEDFFDVANHKTAILSIISVKLQEGNKYTVAGNLTIKGITKPIEFPATIEVRDGKLGAYAEVKVDRTLYDIKYGSGKFFEGLGDKAIEDEFTIKFKVSAI